MPEEIKDDILYLCREEVRDICQTIDSVETMREVFALHGSGQTILPDEAYLGWTNTQGESVRNLNMPGYLGGSLCIAGTKIINGNISNPRRGLPRASGLTLLYDDTSVRILCLMESAYISSLRTASVTALSAELMKRGAIDTVAVIGAGVLAQMHIELLVKRFPTISRILLYDVDQPRIAQLRHSLEGVLLKHEVELLPVKSAESAIRPAQLIVPVTTTTTGYIRYDWLRPGAFLVNVSLDDPLPEVILKADAVVVDDWNLVKNDPHRLLGRMYRQGQVVGPDDSLESSQPACRRIDAQLGDIVNGSRALLDNPDQIIVVNPFGLAIEDVALANRVYQIAQSRGVGTWLKR